MLRKYFLYLSCLLLCLFSISQPLYAQSQLKKEQICRIAFPPWQKGKAGINQLYQPFISELSKETGCTFMSIGGQNYQKTMNVLLTGKVDFAILGASMYVLAKYKNNRLKLVATELHSDINETKLVDYYYGYILSLKKNKAIKKLFDLRGKRFGFVRRESSSGYQYPNALLKKQKINYKHFFKKTYFLGNHHHVIKALVAGSIDAGATWEFNFQQAQKEYGDIFHILAKTPPIPNLAIVAHPSVSPQLVKKLRHALTTMERQYFKNLPVQGYTFRTDGFYNPVRHLIKQN